ncbi:hypothetical protein GGR57DRAFT_519874 [Xylariaceae sp. FL1272]|nr:hypothetical protein GGR57DRAFT_519874 [Xylariaceae sp. FL1272]
MSSLASSYRLYKQDTDALATWLASTAKSLGYSLQSTTDSRSTTGRLKGKARKEAKQANTLGPKYIITIADFIRLANHIAKKRATVPATLMDTLNRVIKMRSSFGARLEKHGVAVDEQSTNNHLYFVEVLKSVRKTLEPFAQDNPREPTSKTAKKSPDAHRGDKERQVNEKHNDFCNRFAGLSVEHPSQEFLDAPEVERPTKAKNDNATYEVVADTSSEHVMFLLMLLVHDMNYIRCILQHVWSGYKSGHYELVAVALTTNTTIDLVRNMIEEIEPLVEANGGFQRMLYGIHVIACCYYGDWSQEDMQVTTQPTVPGTVLDVPVDLQDRFNYNTHDDQTYYVVHRLLGALLRTVRPGRIPFFAHWVYGYWNKKSNRSQQTGEEKTADDQSLLWQYFTEVMVAVRGIGGYPVKEECFRGMEQMVETQRVPFFATFAAQVLLDIAYLLGPDIERPYRTLIEQLNYMDNELRQLVEFNARAGLKPWCASNERLLLKLQRHIIDVMHGDSIREFLETLHTKSGNPQEDVTESTQRLLRISPVTAGLWLFHFRARFEKAGQVVAETWGGLQYCTHLYKALSNENLLNDQWEDMEVVYATLRADSFYVGGKEPTTPMEYMKAIWLQGGMSMQSLQAFSRHSGPIPSKGGARSLKPPAPVLSMFTERYGELGGRVDFTPEYVSQIIELSIYEGTGTGTISPIRDLKRLQKKKTKLRLIKTGASKPVKGGGTIHIRDLIFPLLTALRAEAIEHTVPYFHMHRYCFGVLAGIRDRCGKVLTSRLQNPKFLEDNTKLPFVPLYVFLAACEGDRRLMNRAAEFLNEEVLSHDHSGHICNEIWDIKRGLPYPHYIEEIAEKTKKQEDTKETEDSREQADATETEDNNNEESANTIEKSGEDEAKGEKDCVMEKIKE